MCEGVEPSGKLVAALPTHCRPPVFEAEPATAHPSGLNPVIMYLENNRTPIVSRPTVGCEEPEFSLEIQRVTPASPGFTKGTKTSSQRPVKVNSSGLQASRPTDAAGGGKRGSRFTSAPANSRATIEILIARLTRLVVSR